MASQTWDITKHTQQRPNRLTQKRKKLAEISGNSRPFSRRAANPASSKHQRQPPFALTLLPSESKPKSVNTISQGEHYDCDYIWGLVREQKAQQFLMEPSPATIAARDYESAITGTTTTTQVRKDHTRYAEESLHPRWISIQRGEYHTIDPLEEVQDMVHVASKGDEKSFQQSPDFRSIVGEELFTNISDGHRALIDSCLRYLRVSRASEAQWEADLWRQWFLKGTVRTPDSDPVGEKPFMGRIVQAKMSLSSGSAILPPLLASADARRESGLPVALVPWDPDLRKQKGGHVLWYPDYLYAVSKTSLQLQIKDKHINYVDALPAFRLAQHEYLPASWLAEIKSENTDANHLAAENYCALMSAYLLHERLILHWITKNKDINSNNPIELNNSLAVHCITCCGPAYKIWRMSIRPKDTASHLEPVRYDMQLLDSFHLEMKNGDQRLCDWINSLNALALTVQFESIVKDLKAIQANTASIPLTFDHSYSWTSRIGFVYKAESPTQVCIAPLEKLRKAYNKGTIQAPGRIGDKVIQGWDEEGRALEVDIAVSKALQVPGEAQDSDIPGNPYPGQATELPYRSAPPTSTPARAVRERWTAQMSKIELGRLRSSVIQHIAYTFSVYLGRKNNIGSSKEEHLDYIDNAQRSLRAMDAPVNASGVWKDIGLQGNDLLKLGAETLRTMCGDCGVRDIGPKPTKKQMVAALQAC